MTTRKTKVLVAAALVAVLPARADVQPASMFSDHMVLQREMPVPVWGTADPGESVTVAFADHKATAVADRTGQWRVDLPALEAAATGRDLTIAGNNTLVFKDVLVGEVWICSGQSNMQFGWGKASHPMFNWGGVPELAALVPDARTKPIRSYLVPVNVSFTPEANCAGSWSTNVSGSAVAFGFSYYLQQALDVPVAVIVTCWGSSFIEGWMPRDLTDDLPHFKARLAQLEHSEQAMTRVNAAIERGIRHGFVFVRKQPLLLYNAMLHPVIPYACRGMVWYQGEANAGQPKEYATSLPVWTKRLRKGWGRDDFHLLAVMLPGFGQDNGRPDAKSWAHFREAQMQVLDLPHTSVANTIDLGDAKNIHPADKAPICERLALLARRDVHGEKIVARGPMYAGLTVDGPQLTVAFSSADGMKTSDGGAPKGFWLADEAQNWQPATAKIQGSTITLTAEGVAHPVACRYAFCGKPEVNLVNGAGLPAYPFRTDTWEN